MRVLLLSQGYAPEEISAAILITELSTDLAKCGYEVDVITCAPNYPIGRIFPGYKNHLCHVEHRAGVRVSRVWSYISPKKTFWRRILNYGTFCLMSILGSIRLNRPDLLLSFMPPLPLGISAFLLSRWWRIPWVVQLNDIFPDAAVNTGVLKNPYVITFFSKIERFIYRKATHISVISKNFSGNLTNKNVPPEKISVIPLWADPDIIKPFPKENTFRARYQLNGHFIVMYAGNLGYTSKVEDLLDAAEILKGNKDVFFFIIGEGVKKSSLQLYSEHRGQNNVMFLPFQPREFLSEMLSAADLSIVTLNADSYQTSLPSKVFNIMASERPILSVSPPESEIATIVADSGCGTNLPPDQPEKLAQTILQLKNQPLILEKMGKKGRRLLETRYARSYCVAKFEHMLNIIAK